MRYIDALLSKDLQSYRVLLSGPRQCGKTTFSKWLLKESFTGEYLNWDQVKDRRRIVKQDWSDADPLVVLDEIPLELFRKSGDSMFGRYRSWRLHLFWCIAAGYSTMISGCGQFSSSTGACASSALLGSWTNSQSNETITFTSNCGFTSTICGAQAIASNTTTSSGTVTLDNWSVSGSNCASQSNRTCTYSISGSTLQLTCTPTGGGTYTQVLTT